jgi:hypothetical protein
VEQPQDRRKQLEAQITKGIEAQHFLQFIESEPYFKAVFQEIDNDTVTAILGLDPQNTQAFTVLQAKRANHYELIGRIHQDVHIGQLASAEMEDIDRNGERTQEGIL